MCAQVVERAPLRILRILGERLPYFPNPIQAGEGLRDLGADGRNLDDRRRQEPREKDVHDEFAEGHLAIQDGVAADDDHDDADDADDHR